MATLSTCSLISVIIFGLACLNHSMVIKAGFGSSSSDLSSSSADIYETTSMCKTSKHRINPDELIDPNGNWVFDKNFKQTIEVEICDEEGLPCIDYPMMKTKCRQRYLNIKLQVVSKFGSKNSTRSSQIKTFSIPSNCECIFIN